MDRRGSVARSGDLLGKGGLGLERSNDSSRGFGEECRTLAEITAPVANQGDFADEWRALEFAIDEALRVVGIAGTARQQGHTEPKGGQGTALFFHG